MAQQKIFGYANRISVRPGDEIAFHVNCDGATEAQAQLVRLIHGDSHKDGPGPIEREVDSPVNGTWAVKKQFTQLGSFLEVDDPQQKLAVDRRLLAHGLHLADHAEEGQAPDHSRALGHIAQFTAMRSASIRAGHLEFWVGDGKEVDYVTAEVPLLERVWYLVGVSYDPATGRAEIYQEGVLNRYNSLIGKVVPYDFASHVAQTFPVQARTPGRRRRS